MDILIGSIILFLATWVGFLLMWRFLDKKVKEIQSLEKSIQEMTEKNLLSLILFLERQPPKDKP